LVYCPKLSLFFTVMPFVLDRKANLLYIVS
jgi:hypothetical protein